MAQQGKLDIQVEKKLDAVEEYQFEPIKGYPMLHWKGKRPFSSTQYYPAQLKESYGQEVNGWMNKIFWGDNLQVMSHMLKEYRGKIDLIYIDPPFDSKADYKKKIKLKGKEVYNDTNSFEEKQYTDIWNNDDYLQFMYERLILLKELISDKGSLFLHCDWHKVHLLRSILDEIFGTTNCINEIIVCYTGPTNQKNNFPRKHDTILWYKKGNEHIFNSEKARVGYVKSNKATGKTSLAGRADDDYLDELDEKGKIIEDYWTDIRAGSHIPKQIRESGDNYPTLKDEKILERIISVASNQDSIVFDCFMGSGTTQAVAERLSRKYIGADINLGAIETSIKRLAALKSNFLVYNVNNYDFFRNPVGAKELLKQALEIQLLPNNSIYDGEKDGRMVKIMPVNRIATRADLNELISGFNIKSFEKKFEASPSKPVESLLLVCMGHEPDLAASLQKEMHPYKLDVEVVDILRDKSNLEFKRDSEAEVVKERDKLVIKEFYPMNLLQKLSMMKENVENWKELTESVKVDFNYDGVVFEPSVVDVPEKNELVAGEYKVPEDAGTIRVKITDLLSESLELTIENNN